MIAVEHREAALRREDGADVGVDFTRWVEPHLSVLSAVAAQQVGRVEGPDLVQETLLRAWRKWNTFDPARGAARSWLVAIMYDRARRHRTRRMPVAPSLPAGQHGDGSKVSVEESMDIGRAIDELSPRQRQIVTLHYIAGLTLEQVGETLHISLGATKSQLHAAKRQLRLLLGSAETDD